MACSMQLVLVLLCVLAELSVVAQVLVLQLLQVLVRPALQLSPRHLG